MQNNKVKKDTVSGTVLETDIEISEKQIEIFARRLLPEIMHYFADEEIQQEFVGWLENRREK